MLGVIPAAGKGTRFHELGKQYPKCILPYREVPILVHNIKSLIEAGCTEIIIGASHRIDMIEDVVFDHFVNDEYDVFDHFVNDEYDGIISVREIINSYGMPDTVLQCIQSATDEHSDLLIMLGDIVSNDKPIECHKDIGDWISVRKVSDYNRWCMVETVEHGAGTYVESFDDKPVDRPDTDIAATGIYYLTDIVRFSECAFQVNKNHCFATDPEQQLSVVLENYGGAIRTKFHNIIDLGTHDEYINNRGISTSRSFNEIMKDGNMVTKCSNDHEKIRAEYHWFNDLPLELKAYTPAMYNLNINGSGRSSYSMEFINKPTLREMFLFLDGSIETWDTIFDDLNVVQNEFKVHGNWSHKFLGKMLDKTIARYHQLEDITMDDANKFSEMADALEYMQEDNIYYRRHDSVAHGDFCFSNIMWSPGSVKLIDPRGEMYGSIYYEYAKLYHSIIGHYDFIDAELYTYNEETDCTSIYDNGKEEIGDLFLDKLRKLFTPKELTLIKMLSASLFISMIPLHDHNKNNQKLFMCKFREIYGGAKAEYDSYRS